jgi:hypothetical protein
MLLTIPSKGRASNQVTLRNFKKFAPMHYMPILVVPDNEQKTYRNNNLGIEIVGTPPEIFGISKTREWILTKLARSRGAKHVGMIDDDMDFCYRPNPKAAPLLMVTSSEKMLDMLGRMEAWLNSGFVHVGLSARQGNNNPYKNEQGEDGLHEYRDATRMMNFYIYDVSKLRELDIKLGRMDVMEDFDLTLQLLRKGFPNRVLYEYCWNQRGSGATGGCSTYRTAEMQAKAAHKLAALHPDFVNIKLKKSKANWKGLEERVDVIVGWRKAFESSGKVLA